MKVSAGIYLDWSEIDLAPLEAGVYAWYSQLIISKADIIDVVRKINQAKAVSDQSAREEVCLALDRFIFNPYRETSYRVMLRGQLKPKYSGEILHEPSKSDSLINKLVETPERFEVICNVLKGAAPAFTAPLYIGMAKNLRRRLRQHKAKIIELRNNLSTVSSDDEIEAGFAKQVVARNFDPTNLFVHVSPVQVESDEHNDIENILNRINYPIFGRN
ncbi:GIY-YIG nuclease family protein [Pseudomonas graminis]|uniref:Uncharacterized protein n=1 Tax=Pseudomonas graminis TaxID=158627 RepID=A0A6M8MQI1_9PSED|nr:GIY-YIG nuclease family protein [Pseudomonas graminis]QKF49337.1 hypothetical protein FX982_00256 [Pseudomonas graminis]